MSDGDATASTFGVPPLEDPALRTYLPWEVVYHSVAGPSEHEVSRQLVLDPLTGFFRECNLTGPLSRIWVLDQGAKLVGFDAQHKFERTSFVPSPGGGRASVGLFAEFKCVLTGRHIRTSTDAAVVAPTLCSSVVEQARGGRLDEAATTMVHAAVAAALMERVRVHAVAAGGRLARATGMPRPPAGPLADAPSGAAPPGAAELCVHAFGEDSPACLSVARGDAATDRMLWTDIGITAVAEAAGCVVKDEGVFVPADADFPEDFAESAAIGRICTETLTALLAVVLIGVQSPDSTAVLMLWDHLAWEQIKNNPSLAGVPALWERLVNAGEAVDELVGGAAASARSARCRAMGARAAAMRHAYSAGADSRALDVMTATFAAADGAWKALAQAAGASFLEPIEVMDAARTTAAWAEQPAVARPAASSETSSATGSAAAGSAAAASATAGSAAAGSASESEATDVVPGCSGLIVRATPPDVRAARVAVDTVRMNLGLRLGATAGTCSAVPLRSPGQPAGLENLGNTCYLNAMLQAIAHCPQLRNRILLMRTDAAADRARAFVAAGLAATAPERTLAHARRMMRAADLLAELQHLVALLVASDRQAVDPSQFVEAFAACKGGEGAAQPALWSSLSQFQALVARDNEAAAHAQAAADEAFATCLRTKGEGCSWGGAEPEGLHGLCRAEARRAAANFVGMRAKQALRGQASAAQPRFNALAFFAQEDADEWRDSILTLADDVALGFAALPDGGFNGVAADAAKDTPRHFGAPQSTLAGVNSLRGALSAVVRPAERRDGVSVPAGPTQPLDALRLTPVLAERCTDASGQPIEDMMTAMQCCADPALAARSGVTVTADLCQSDFLVALPSEGQSPADGLEVAVAPAAASAAAVATAPADQLASSAAKRNLVPAELGPADSNDTSSTPGQSLAQENSNDEAVPAVPTKDETAVAPPAAGTAAVAGCQVAAPPLPPSATAAAVTSAAAAASSVSLPAAFGLFAAGQPGVYPALAARFDWGADGRPPSHRMQLLALPPVLYLSIARSSAAELRTRVRVPLSLCLDDLVGEGPDDEGGPWEGVRTAQRALAAAEAVVAAAALSAAGPGFHSAADLEEGSRQRQLALAVAARPVSAAPRSTVSAEVRMMLELGSCAFESEAEFEATQAAVKRVDDAGRLAEEAKKRSAMAAGRVELEKQARDRACAASCSEAAEAAAAAAAREVSAAACAEAVARQGSAGTHGADIGSPSGVRFDDVIGRNSVVQALRQHVHELYQRVSRERFGLRAVLVHAGPTSEGGHYVCYAAGDDGVWWRLDDSNVTAVTVEEMLEAAEGGSAMRRASTLFYEREAEGSRQAIDTAGPEGADGCGDVTAAGAAAEAESSAAASLALDDVTPGKAAPASIRPSPWDPASGFAHDAPATAAPAPGAPPPAVVAASGQMWWRSVVPAERVSRVVSSVRGALLPRHVAAFIAADNRHVQASGTLEAADSAGIRLGAVLADIARMAAAAASTAQRPRQIVGAFGLTRAELERWARDEVALLVRINGVERGIAAATLVHPSKGEVSLPRCLSPAELAAGWGGAGWLASGLLAPKEDLSAASGAGGAASGAGGAASGAGGAASGAGAEAGTVEAVASPRPGEEAAFDVANAECTTSPTATSSEADAAAVPSTDRWPALAFTSWSAATTTDTDGSQRISSWFGRPPWEQQLTVAEHVGICTSMLSAFGPELGPVAAPCQSRLCTFAQRFPAGVRWTRAPPTSLLGWSTMDHSRQSLAAHRQWTKRADAFRQADWSQGPVTAMVGRLRGLEARRAAAAAVAVQADGETSAALGSAENEAWLALGGAADREAAASGDDRADCVDAEVMASLEASDPGLPVPVAQLPGPEAPILAPPLPGVLAAAAFARARLPGVVPRLEREFVIPLVVSPMVSTAKTIHWFVLDEAAALDADHLRHVPADWILPNGVFLRMRALLRTTRSLDACLQPVLETARDEPQLRLGATAQLMLTAGERAVLAASDEFASHPMGPVDGVSQPYAACRRAGLPRGTVAGILMRAFGSDIGDAASRIAAGTRLRSAYMVAEARSADNLERSGGSARCVIAQTGLADSMLG